MPNWQSDGRDTWHRAMMPFPQPSANLNGSAASHCTSPQLLPNALLQFSKANRSGFQRLKRPGITAPQGINAGAEFGPPGPRDLQKTAKHPAHGPALESRRLEQHHRPPISRDLGGQIEILCEGAELERSGARLSRRTEVSEVFVSDLMRKHSRQLILIIQESQGPVTHDEAPSAHRKGDRLQITHDGEHPPTLPQLGRYHQPLPEPLNIDRDRIGGTPQGPVPLNHLRRGTS